MLTILPSLTTTIVSGDFSNVKIPLFIIDQYTGDLIANSLGMDLLKGEPTLICVEHDFNQWYSDTQGAGWIVLQTVLLIWFSVNLFIGVKGLFSNIYHDGITPNPPQVNLFFNNVASVLLILSMVDPWNIRGIVSAVFAEVTFILSLPAFLSGMATFAFYFNEVLIREVDMFEVLIIGMDGATVCVSPSIS